MHVVLPRLRLKITHHTRGIDRSTRCDIRLAFFEISHTFLVQFGPRLTCMLIPCDAFYTREKQSDTFAEQRRHFISTAPPAAWLAHSRFRGRLIDGVPFRFSPLGEVVLFLPQFLYFFRRAPDRRNDRLTDAGILSFSSLQPRSLSSSPAQRLLRWSQDGSASVHISFVLSAEWRNNPPPIRREAPIQYPRFVRITPRY